MRNQRRRHDREGSVAVEFAFMAPMLVALLIGLWQATSIHHVRNQFMVAAREGARLATLERSEVVDPGESIEDSIIASIRQFLTANQLPGDSVDISITDPLTGDDFDLDDPANDMKYFQVAVECSCVESLPIPPVGLGDNYKIAARVVFRNGYAQVVE